jgi:hypothetical protein
MGTSIISIAFQMNLNLNKTLESLTLMMFLSLNNWHWLNINRIKINTQWGILIKWWVKKNLVKISNLNISRMMPNLSEREKKLERVEMISLGMTWIAIWKIWKWKYTQMTNTHKLWIKYWATNNQINRKKEEKDICWMGKI